MCQTVHASFRSQRFRDTNRTFAPPGLWDRLTFILSGTASKSHPRSINLPRMDADGSGFRHNRTSTTVTWIGHSTVLIQLDGVSILRSSPNSVSCAGVPNRGASAAIEASSIAYSRVTDAPRSLTS